MDTFWCVEPTGGADVGLLCLGPHRWLTLKPEITGIGGNVFSAYYEDYFCEHVRHLHGSPAVAASAALVRQYLKEQGVAEEGLADLVNRLLMSTATPIVDEAHDTFYFVRRQGAGLANPAAAMASQAYIQVGGHQQVQI